MVLYHVRRISTPMWVKCVRRYNNKPNKNQPLEIQGMAKDLVHQYNATFGTYEEVEDTDDNLAFSEYLVDYIYYFDIKYYINQKVKSHNHMRCGL